MRETLVSAMGGHGASRRIVDQWSQVPLVEASHADDRVP